MNIRDFARESNRIEGIKRVKLDEIAVYPYLLDRAVLDIDALCKFVRVVAGPGHRLRDEPGMDVRVGNYLAPPGGPAIKTGLELLLNDINNCRLSPYHAHVRYELLHPFTDGNGRSGRAIWLWMMRHSDPYRLPFLHRYYYQSLEASGK